MPYARVGEQDLYFEDSGGDLPPVVLAHGFLMDHEMFAPQVAALQDRYRVITWDQRGFGKTVFDGRPFDLWASAEDCLGLMDHLRIREAVVGGMSQGGFVALRIALMAPHRVRALILLSTEAGVFDAADKAANDNLNHAWLDEGPTDELVRSVAGTLIDDPAHESLWIAKWQSRPKELFRLPYRCLADRSDLSGRLSEIVCPALVVHGTEDVAVPVGRGEALAAGLTGCEGLVRVAGAHTASMTNPVPVDEAIRDFLDRLPELSVPAG